MINKSRFALAIVLTLVLGVAGLAWATGADVNDGKIEAKVSPTKAPAKKKPKNGSIFLGVINQQPDQGQPSHSDQNNPKAEELSVDKSISVMKQVAKKPECPSSPPNGATPEQAKATCPADAFLGSGVAETVFPPPLGTVSDIEVNVFHGPAGATPPAGRRAASSVPLILHTYSPTLQTAAPVVQAFLVKSRAGKKYGETLWVPNAPQTGPGLITKFNALIPKDKKVVKVLCPKGKWKYTRKTTFNDGSSESYPLTQKCKTQK